MNPSTDPSVALLYPMTEFDVAGRPIVSEVEALAADRVPEPYHRLLVHEQDMTPTLESFHGQRLSLRVVNKRSEGRSLYRLVCLVGDDDGRLAEFGAIRIDLARFEPEPRRLIEACDRPLGAILEEHRIPHESRTAAYLRVGLDDQMRRELNIDVTSKLYGRRNALADPTGRILAEIVEILPTLGTSAAE